MAHEYYIIILDPNDLFFCHFLTNKNVNGDVLPLLMPTKMRDPNRGTKEISKKCIKSNISSKNSNVLSVP